MSAQFYIDKAVQFLQGPTGFIVLGVFVAGCIAMLKMNANQR